MFLAYKWQIGAVVTLVFGMIDAARAQSYAPPNANSVQSNYTAPTVNSYLQSMAQNRSSVAYTPNLSGTNSPNNYYSRPNSSASSAARIGLGTGGRASKPFSSYSGSSSPAVSPYLNLFRTDLSTGGNFNYNTLVQPQLQQQQINQQLERQALQDGRRLQQIAAQAEYNAQGNKDEYPTGHQTVYNYMGRYYQMPQIRNKGRR